MKVLIATEKPFAAVAVKGIRDVVEQAGMECVLLEKYTDKAQLPPYDIKLLQSNSMKRNNNKSMEL